MASGRIFRGGGGEGDVGGGELAQHHSSDRRALVGRVRGVIESREWHHVPAGTGAGRNSEQCPSMLAGKITGFCVKTHNKHSVGAQMATSV